MKIAELQFSIYDFDSFKQTVAIAIAPVVRHQYWHMGREELSVQANAFHATKVE